MKPTLFLSQGYETHTLFPSWAHSQYEGTRYMGNPWGKDCVWLIYSHNNSCTTPDIIAMTAWFQISSSPQIAPVLRRMGRMIIRSRMMIKETAKHIHLRLLLWCCLAILNSPVPLCTNESALFTCCSISFNCSPWLSTSTAMSRKIWCSSNRFFSMSFIALWRSWISWTVSVICLSPWYWMACCKKDSLFPVSMMLSMVSSSGCSPVIV